MRHDQVLSAIQPSDRERLDSILVEFLRDSKVRCALVADRAGRLVSSVGETGGFDGVSFATLAAADFEASDQLAMLLGEEEFTSLYHQGDETSMYLADVGGHAILASLFDDRTTMGLVRLKCREAASAMTVLLEEVVAREPAASDTLEAGWVIEAADEIDRLFAD